MVGFLHLPIRFLMKDGALKIENGDRPENNKIDDEEALWNCNVLAWQMRWRWGSWIQ